MWKLIWLILAIVFGFIATFNWATTPKFNFLAASVTCLALSFLPIGI